jgi:hypothetical protein
VGYDHPVMARLLALAIALSVGATGLLPARDRARCVAMDRLMAPGDDCCPRCTEPSRSIGPPCCELVHGRVLDARSPAPPSHARIAPAPFAGFVAFASCAAAARDPIARRLAAVRHERPPGDRGQRLSTVLRV